MISTALILASAAYAQSRIAPAGVMYYSANQNQVIIPGVGIAPATGDCQGVRSNDHLLIDRLLILLQLAKNLSMKEEVDVNLLNAFQKEKVRAY